MPTLSAKFKLQISSPCLLYFPEGHIAEVELTLGGFHVAAKLRSSIFWSSKSKLDDPFETTGLDELEITVSRSVVETPPRAVVTADGKRDLTLQGEYLNSKLPDYRSAALEIANRILRFFQYSLFTPQVRQIPVWEHSLNNPTWIDDSGEIIQVGNYLIVMEPIPGLRGELGAQSLSLEELPKLQSFLEAPSEPTLAVMYLSDAQTAWFEGSLRRSVLELAICTEVMVKRTFFSQSTPAGAAFDYLEDKAKVSVRVLELLDSIAEEAFARSYKKEEPLCYQNIDHLFRCRNKIAHRGVLTFRDDSGKTISVNASLVEEWWSAVANLRRWLQSLQNDAGE